VRLTPATIVFRPDEHETKNELILRECGSDGQRNECEGGDDKK